MPPIPVQHYRVHSSFILHNYNSCLWQWEIWLSLVLIYLPIWSLFLMSPISYHHPFSWTSFLPSDSVPRQTLLTWLCSSLCLYADPSCQAPSLCGYHPHSIWTLIPHKIPLLSMTILLSHPDFVFPSPHRRVSTTALDTLLTKLMSSPKG